MLALSAPAVTRSTGGSTWPRSSRSSRSPPEACCVAYLRVRGYVLSQELSRSSLRRKEGEVPVLSALVSAATLAVSACGSGPGDDARQLDSRLRARGAAPGLRTRDLPGHGTAPTIQTPAVKPQRDGVHIRFVNKTGEDRSLSVDRGSERRRHGLRRAAGNVYPGARPSSPELSRSPATTATPRTEASRSPRRLWRSSTRTALWTSARLDCERRLLQRHRLRARRHAARPTRSRLRRKALVELLAERRRRRAGRLSGSTEARIYRLVRAGETLATVSLFADGAGGWLPDGVTGCSSLEE